MCFLTEDIMEDTSEDQMKRWIGPHVLPADVTHWAPPHEQIPGGSLTLSLWDSMEIPRVGITDNVGF